MASIIRSKEPEEAIIGRTHQLTLCLKCRLNMVLLSEFEKVSVQRQVLAYEIDLMLSPERLLVGESALDGLRWPSASR